MEQVYICEMELSPTDIHFLAALLLSCADGRDIEIELGDLVYDEAAEKERDIDITVTKRNSDGSIHVYKAIEVKDHTKPLDVIHVEQLCAKMADMPDLTERSIVSSSGYTRPAIKKALKKGVELLEIVPWKDTTKGFDFWNTGQENYEFADYKNNWDEYFIRFNLDNGSQYDVGDKAIIPNIEICDANGNQYPNVPNLATLKQSLFDQSRTAWGNTDQCKEAELDKAIGMMLNLNLAEKTYFKWENKLYGVRNAEFHGLVRKTKTVHTGDFKLLRRVGEDIPLTGCAIFISNTGHLVGIAMSNVEQRKMWVIVPFEDRIKNKIVKHRINRN
jgi:hypothetical protein